jgi:hypothetical protein
LKLKYLINKLEYDTNHSINKIENKHNDYEQKRNINSLFLTSPKNQECFVSPRNKNKKEIEFTEEKNNELENLKNKLGIELDELIKREKEKEDQRIKNYTNEADDEIKKILQNAINRDRMESSNRVKEFNE